MKYLIDYQGMADSFLKGSSVVHQAFLPAGFLGAIDDTPYTLDVEKAKALLEEAGVGPINVEALGAQRPGAARDRPVAAEHHGAGRASPSSSRSAPAPKS